MCRHGNIKPKLCLSVGKPCRYTRKRRQCLFKRPLEHFWNSCMQKGSGLFTQLCTTGTGRGAPREIHFKRDRLQKLLPNPKRMLISTPPTLLLLCWAGSWLAVGAQPTGTPRVPQHPGKGRATHAPSLLTTPQSFWQSWHETSDSFMKPSSSICLVFMILKFCLYAEGKNYHAYLNNPQVKWKSAAFSHVSVSQSNSVE